MATAKELRELQPQELDERVKELKRQKQPAAAPAGKGKEQP